MIPFGRCVLGMPFEDSVQSFSLLASHSALARAVRRTQVPFLFNEITMAKSTSVVADSDSASDSPKPRRRKKTRTSSTGRSKSEGAESTSAESSPKPTSAPSKPAEPSSGSSGGGESASRSGGEQREQRSSGSGGGDGSSQQQQQQNRYANYPSPSRTNNKRKKNKKRKNRPGGPGGGGGMASLPSGAVPTDEDIAREAEVLREMLSGKKGEKERANAISIAELQAMPLADLHKLAEKEKLEDFHQLHKSELVYRIAKARAEAGGLVIADGTLEIMHEGFGFLRSAQSSYLSGPDDIYVSPSTIRRLKLRKGMVIRGPVCAPRDSQKYFALIDVDSVNGQDPKTVANLATFEDLTPLHPEERLVLETAPQEIEMRVVDLVSPIGKGQRGLIVAPPRTGKTVLLQKMTRAISQNHPEAKVLVLLIDERPEEVTDFRRNTPEAVEVVASTFDEKSSRHVQVAEMVIEKAKRAVEFGEHVIILLDSITRLARAYNNEMPHSGKIMTGGIDSGALQRPKKFFGAARAIENGGSLTILATALVDTGSKADEVIFEEFKGTGNSELHLDRRLVEKRVWPAIDINASGTRREELLLDPKELDLVYRLRKVLADMNVVEAMELLKGRLGKSKTNAEFLMTMNLG